MNSATFTNMEAALIANTERPGACPQRSEDSRRGAPKVVLSAINFDSDGGAAITAPLPVGNTGRTSNQGAA